jgi:hypothetical protein
VAPLVRPPSLLTCVIRRSASCVSSPRSTLCVAQIMEMMLGKGAPVDAIGS